MSTISPLSFLQKGIAVIPLADRSKEPRIAWARYQTELPTEENVVFWFKNGRNFGVVCGWLNLVVVDFDNASEYSKWRQWASGASEIAARVARDAFQVQTARGVHVYVRTANLERGRKLGAPTIDANGKEHFAVEIRGAKQYVVGPESVHPTGAIYTTLREHLYMPRVETLSAILPVSLLTTNTGQHNASCVGASPDPRSAWERADAVAVSLGQGAVQHILGTWKIEDIVTPEQKTGAHHWLAKCPLHDDDAPSFWMDTQKQICNCFACAPQVKPMDVIDLYARVHSLTGREAIAVMSGRTK